MNNNIKIAIDGPSGAGKSTLAKKIASELGYIYLDTGAMYRSFGLYAIESGVDFSRPDDDNVSKIKSLTDCFSLDVVYESGAQQVYVNGRNFTSMIRTPEVSIAASKVAVIPEVRLKLVELQRKIASRHSVVMDGRDIGTYVLPDANVKIFLTASPEVRAKRRFDELAAKGNKNITFEDVLSDMKFRDKNDSARAFAPLKMADDAVLVDTSDMNETESEKAILSIIIDKINR